MFVTRGQNIDITCLHPCCHESTSAAASDDAWASRFIARHQALHKERECP